jgi:transcription elongation factor Elf1
MFPTKERLRTHRQKHEAKFACDLCGSALHSLTSHLNTSAFCGIGCNYGFFRGCLGGV